MISQRRICLDLNINSRPVTKFEGERIYVSTGDSDDMEKAEVVTFYNRPSRANVSPLINDVIFAKMADTDKTFLIDGVLNKYIYSTGFFDVSSTRILPRFLYYLIQSDEFNAYKNAYSEGTTQVAISDKRLKKIKITYETNKINQQKIADYLDKKVSIIDRLIDNIKKQLEELKNEKISSIKEFLQNNKKGEIVRLQDVVKMKKGPFGSSLKKEVFVPEGENVFKVYEQQHAIDGSATIGDYYIDKNKYLELYGFAVKAGDIIISCAGTIGRLFILPEHIHAGVINQALMRVRVNKKKITNYFFSYVWNYLILDEILKNSNGSAIQNIPAFSVLNKIKFVLPELCIQKQIVTSLDKKVDSFDRLVKVKQQKIAELNKYKKSLIYECVTGKKEIL